MMTSLKLDACCHDERSEACVFCPHCERACRCHHESAPVLVCHHERLLRPSYDCHHERTSVREGPAFRVAETIYSPLIIFFHDTGHQLADLALVGAESGGSAVEQPQQVALKYSARLPAFAQVLESPK